MRKKPARNAKKVKYKKLLKGIWNQNLTYIALSRHRETCQNKENGIRLISKILESDHNDLNFYLRIIEIIGLIRFSP